MEWPGRRGVLLAIGVFAGGTTFPEPELDRPAAVIRSRGSRESMTDDLLFLRALVASQDGGLRDLFRQAASSSPTPMELLDAADATAACNSLVAGVDLVYLDGALPAAEIAQVVSTMRAAVKPPFINPPWNGCYCRQGVCHRWPCRKAVAGRRSTGAGRSFAPRAGTEPRTGGRRFLDHAFNCPKSACRDAVSVRGERG